MFDYKITNAALDIYLGGFFLLMSIKFDDIESVDKSTWPGLINVDPFTLRLPNRLAWTNVVIARRHGMFKKIAITPKEPDEIVKTIRERMG